MRELHHMTEKDIINALNRMVTNLETCIKAKQILITREKEAEHLLYTTIGAVNIINRLKFENERLLQKSQQPPTEDVVEVVRCKDCEYFGKNRPYRNNKLPFSFCDKFHHNIMKENDFCSYGKRKEVVNNA